MANANQRDIRRELRKMDIERMQEVTSRMADYDAGKRSRRSELQKQCGEIGHKAASAENNGFGTSWLRCGVCDARFEIIPSFDLSAKAREA